MNVDKIKTHVNEHKKVYVVGATCLTIGVLGTLAVVRTGAISFNPVGDSNAVVAPSVNQVLSWKPSSVLEVHIEALGDPGNIVQDLTTGTIYASQGQAAKAVGATSGQMSKHLSGATNFVNGHAFVKLGKAMVSEA